MLTITVDIAKSSKKLLIYIFISLFFCSNCSEKLYLSDHLYGYELHFDKGDKIGFKVPIANIIQEKGYNPACQHILNIKEKTSRLLNPRDIPKDECYIDSIIKAGNSIFISGYMKRLDIDKFEFTENGFFEQEEPQFQNETLNKIYSNKNQTLPNEAICYVLELRKNKKNKCHIYSKTKNLNTEYTIKLSKNENFVLINIYPQYGNNAYDMIGAAKIKDDDFNFEIIQSERVKNSVKNSIFSLSKKIFMLTDNEIAIIRKKSINSITSINLEIAQIKTKDNKIVLETKKEINEQINNIDISKNMLDNPIHRGNMIIFNTNNKEIKYYDSASKEIINKEIKQNEKAIYNAEVNSRYHNNIIRSYKKYIYHGKKYSYYLNISAYKEDQTKNLQDKEESSDGKINVLQSIKNPDISEEIEGIEAPKLTANIIEFDKDKSSYEKRMKLQEITSDNNENYSINSNAVSINQNIGLGGGRGDTDADADADADDSSVKDNPIKKHNVSDKIPSKPEKPSVDDAKEELGDELIKRLEENGRVNISNLLNAVRSDDLDKTTIVNNIQSKIDETKNKIQDKVDDKKTDIKNKVVDSIKNRNNIDYYEAKYQLIKIDNMANTEVVAESDAFRITLDAKANQEEAKKNNIIISKSGSSSDIEKYLTTKLIFKTIDDKKYLFFYSKWLKPQYKLIDIKDPYSLYKLYAIDINNEEETQSTNLVNLIKEKNILGECIEMNNTPKKNQDYEEYANSIQVRSISNNIYIECFRSDRCSRKILTKSDNQFEFKENNNLLLYDLIKLDLLYQGRIVKELSGRAINVENFDNVGDYMEALFEADINAETIQEALDNDLLSSTVKDDIINNGYLAADDYFEIDLDDY